MADGLAKWTDSDPYATTSNPFRIKTSEKITSKNFRCFDPKAAKFSVVFMRNGSVEVIIRAFSQSIKGYTNFNLFVHWCVFFLRVVSIAFKRVFFYTIYKKMWGLT